MQSNPFYSLLFLMTMVIFTACDSDTSASSDANRLEYDETGRSITGQLSFEMGTIPSNHSEKLSDFVPVITGCSVDYASSSFAPAQLLFSPETTTGVLTVDIELDSVCSSPTLELKAKRTVVSTLDGKFFTSVEDKVYTFDVKVATVMKSYTPVLQTTEINLTKNSETQSIVVSVFDQNNIPASSGSVHVVYPSEAAEGVDVGSFNAKTAAVTESGKAIFSYTGPVNLPSLVNAGKSGTSFKFYYGDEVTNVVELSVNYVPDEGQIVITTYEILFNPRESSAKMSLEEVMPFSVSIVNEEGSAVSNSDMDELNISLENRAIASLMDTSGTSGTVLTYEDQNSITASVVSGIKSGLVPLKVSAGFKDVNGKKIKLNETFNVIIESGPPTAISISYVGTDQDKERSKFIEKIAVSVTDKYLNPVNTNPSVSVGAVVGYARYDGGDINHRIYINDGTLATLEKDTLTLNRNLIDVGTTDIDVANDTLVTFGNGYSYPASGAWGFNDFSASTILLDAGQYEGNRSDGMGYAIGRNIRQDACNYGEEWLGQSKLTEGATTLDEKGTAIIELSYDYYLVGKSVVVYANIIGKDNNLDRELKLGEAKKHTLRGHGIETRSGDLSLTAEGTETSTGRATGRFYTWIEDTPEYYRNARFGFAGITTSGRGHIVSTRHMPIESCEKNGHSYVEYTIEADVNSTFGIVLSDPLISSEF